ncbi:MAG: AAA family ATPase [Xanthomonadales bacterium]|nr:AAA family ATPase [Xanthomonadales bacterium]
MRIHRIKLENWRGIDAREIELDEGVTIIEGPNEIGKTTFVEAIRFLFRILDSSKAKDVKAIQPAGRDVGSRVEAEITTGDYRFTYAKVYNRNTETTLHVTAPVTEQFTGREAHEKATAMLEETMDLALWDALLVDQGKEVGQAKLNDSEGLSKSLDEVAGAGGTGYEESGLIAAAEAEYARYFTPTGLPRNRTSEETLRQAEAELESARQALSSIEQDVQEHERSAKDVSRLRELIPGLQANVEKHAAEWERVNSLKVQLEARQRDRADAAELLKSAQDDQHRRAGLSTEITDKDAKIRSLEEGLEPLTRLVDELKGRFDAAQLALDEEKVRKKTIGAALQRAAGDREHLERKETLRKEAARLDKLAALAKEKSAALETLASNRVDDARLELIREAHTRHKVAVGKRDMAATRVTVEADARLQLQVDERQVKLEPAGLEQLDIASETRICFPGVASVLIAPPKSAEDLDQEHRDLEKALDDLLADSGVAGYAEAVAANQARQSAERDLKAIKRQEKQLLEDEGLAEIEQRAEKLQTECEAYQETRPQQPELPASLSEAARRVDALRDELAQIEETFEGKETKLAEIRAERDAAILQLELAQQEKSGLAEARKQNQGRLEAARKGESDEALARRVSKREQELARIDEAIDQLRADLKKASPDATEAKYLNARQAHERACSELRDADKQLAVLADRLQQARANGRYEAFEAAGHEFETAAAAHREAIRRAAAAELLWETLSSHRDATRKAYVRPLKECIERLGEIVFGAGFEVDIDNDWKLVSRTLNGQSLPFDSLSVGAREQLGIITRLAAAQIVSKQGGVPLIIDDALGFSDPARLESMGAAIARAGQDCQILLMTCSPGRFSHVGNAALIKIQ